VIYVTGHRNPDADSIAAAVGYAELLGRVDPSEEYQPVRLGDVNSQTRWLLDRAGARQPEFLPHIYVRACDVMRERFPIAHDDDPVRSAGLEMANHDLDLMPVVGDDGELVGVMTERALARRYIRESREVSSLVDTPASVARVVEVLEGALLAGDGEKGVEGRVWAHSMDVGSTTRIAAGDVVVVGDRPDAQRLALERGAALVVTSNSTTPGDEILALARERGAAVISSPLDTYVSARMITLAAPCRGLMEAEPLTVAIDELASEVAERVREVHYRAAVAVDSGGRPVGLLTRAELLRPKARRVVLVDHAEQAQSVAGVEEAEVVEILDHHHIGSIETHVPVRATFDPVGSTATLVTERFRQNGMEPAPSTATLLLGAVLSDTVILISPTTTERDRRVVEYLERVLAVEAVEFGREMFERSSDVSGVGAAEIVSRDSKEYEASSGQKISIAQVETVGKTLLERKDELLDAVEAKRERGGHALSALMVTDILSKSTDLLVAGERAAAERALGHQATDGVIELPGVISRKKQVAPPLLTAL